jgi:thioredoxin-dependent peroxiredoxin
VIRGIDSVQLMYTHKVVATPVNWKPREEVIIPTSMSDEDARKAFPGGCKTLKPYLWVTQQPK